MNSIKQSVLDAIPNEGDKLSGGEVKKRFGLIDEDWKSIKAELSQQGLVILGRGRGGSVTRSGQTKPLPVPEKPKRDDSKRLEALEKARATRAKNREEEAAKEAAEAREARKARLAELPAQVDAAYAAFDKLKKQAERSGKEQDYKRMFSQQGVCINYNRQLNELNRS